MSTGILLEVPSARERAGCKGPGAEAWLASHGVTVPVGANRYAIDSSGVLSARLATSEFLLEALVEPGDGAVRLVRQALEYADYPKGVYPVLRQDFVLEISGPQTQQLFLQTCAVDLEPVARHSSEATGPVIMTSMIGVSVVLTCRQLAAGPRFTVWIDPSYSTYFRSQLFAIADDISRGNHP
jgi:hypothetical protein